MLDLVYLYNQTGACQSRRAGTVPKQFEKNLDGLSVRALTSDLPVGVVTSAR